jgi:diguanylate cyclase (GGDEF)-like protein
MRDRADGREVVLVDRSSTVDIDWERLSRSLAAAAPEEGGLVVIQGAELGRHYRLPSTQPTVIGRDDGCTVVLARDDVSRRHAELAPLAGGGFTVRDLGSTNGVFVDGVRVESEAVLAHGQLLAVGGAILRYVSGRDVEARFHEEIYRMTVRDGLTGLHNRRFLLELLEREVARAHRHHRRLSVAMIDADRFKALNDTYGHPAGDQLLRLLGERVNARVRRDQLLARYGGEELCMVLPEQDLDGALLCAERVRRDVASAPFALAAAPSGIIHLSVSIGVAELRPGEDAAALLAAADQALYRAKDEGRDRVVAR